MRNPTHPTTHSIWAVAGPNATERGAHAAARRRVRTLSRFVRHGWTETLKRAGTSLRAGTRAHRVAPPLFVGVLLLLPVVAYAGQIYGRITTEGKPIPEGSRVVVTNSAGTYTATTNKYGAYQLTTAEPKSKSPQTLWVYYGKQALSIPVNPTGSTSRYNLVVERKKGRYVLRQETADESRSISATQRALP